MHAELPQPNSLHLSPPSLLPEPQNTSATFSAHNMTVDVPAPELPTWNDWSETQRLVHYSELGSTRDEPYSMNAGYSNVASPQIELKSENSENLLAYDCTSAISPGFMDAVPEAGPGILPTPTPSFVAPDFSSVPDAADFWALEHLKDSQYSATEIGFLQVNEEDHSPGFFHFDQ